MKSITLKTIALTVAAAIPCITSCTSHLAPPSPSPVIVGSPDVKYRASEASARVLLKTGSISIEVSDVNASTAHTRQIIKRHSGYVENISNSADSKPYARLHLRVPSNSLLPAMDELAKLGRVTSRDVEVEDVTEQRIDMQAKLKNLRALRDRLRKLLNQAKNVKEMLEVEKELTRVQSELDSLEGKIKAMRKHATYSKLTVRLSTKSVPGPLGAVGKGTWWGVKKLFVLR